MKITSTHETARGPAVLGHPYYLSYSLGEKSGFDWKIDSMAATDQIHPHISHQRLLSKRGNMGNILAPTKA